MPNKATAEIKAFTQTILESPAYRAALKKRLVSGKSPQLEVLMHYYAYGKPKDHLHVDGIDLPRVEVIRHQPAMLEPIPPASMAPMRPGVGR